MDNAPRKCKVAVFLCYFLVYGCETTVSIRSNPPDAEVGIILPQRDVPKIIGKTPFDSDLSEIDEAVNVGTVVLVVRKAGHVPQRFVIPNLSFTEVDIEANLLPYLQSDYAETNRIISLAFKAERHLLEKRFDDAIKISDEIKKINENVAAAYQIEGTAFYMQREFKKARSAWIRTVELQPNNHEARTILAKIEEQLGNKRAQSN